MNKASNVNVIERTGDYLVETNSVGMTNLVSHYISNVYDIKPMTGDDELIVIAELNEDISKELYDVFGVISYPIYWVATCVKKAE